MIYAPEYKNGNCIVITNNETIRVYETTPTYNSDISYKEYYPKLNYSYNEGVQHFSSYSTLPVCREGTNNIMYRTDINIIVSLVLIIIVLILSFLYNFLKEVF